MNRDEFKEVVKAAREKKFLQPYELAYKVFNQLGYDEKSPDFFESSASKVVEEMRNACWNEFVSEEKVFTSDMLRELIDEDKIKNLSPVDAVSSFVTDYPEHIYDLSLSNTQSRRSRAGKEFEAIIELILIGADIPLDSQGNIGKKLFTDKGLGKLVDVVSPGVMEYLIDKNDTVLISAKTTLRERWQEVPEEVSRTGANSMYLITLDDSVSQNVLDELYEANVILTTIESVKEKSYKDNKRVMTFEQLIKKCKDVKEDWEAYSFSDEQKDEIIMSLEKQQAKHTNHDFVLKYYAERLAKLMNK